MARSAADQVAMTVLGTAAALWLWCGGGACTAAVAVDKSSDVATLTQLSDAWDQAIVRKDEKAIADNMASDFRMIDGYGELSDKAAFVRDIVDPKLTINPYTVEEFSVRIYGDVALLSGRSHMTGTHDGKPFTSNYRYIDIYARTKGTWKIVSVQITKFPPEKTGG
jgi:ketosteroid isomerase-like protein